MKNLRANYSVKTSDWD